jgi:hypothetical protein
MGSGVQSLSDHNEDALGGHLQQLRQQLRPGFAVGNLGGVKK